MISLWFRRTTLGTTQYLAEAGTTSRWRLQFHTDNTMHMLMTDNGGGTIVGDGFLDPTQITGVIADTNWHHLAMAWDTQAVSTGSWKVYLDGVDQSAEVGADGADGTSADLNRGDRIGISNGTSTPLEGEIAQLYMNFNLVSYFDLSVSGNREKFYDSANHLPRNLGADGTATGLPQPDHLLNTAASSYGTNAGNGGDWTVNGTFADAAAGPGPAQSQPE
jgi:hypothetical protein